MLTYSRLSFRFARRRSIEKKPRTRHQISQAWGRLLQLEQLEDRSLLSTFTVINTGDNGGVNPPAGAGTGSLRQAIVDANAASGPDDIRFNVPGAGVQTITPETALPWITSPVAIDGYTQPGSIQNTSPSGSNAVLLIELNGANAAINSNQAGLPVTGLDFRGGSDGSAVRGLAINRFSGAGISAYVSSNHVIEGNYIGTDPSGSMALGNINGIYFGGGSSRNRIGTDGDGTNDLAERNLISGNVTASNNAQTGHGVIIVQEQTRDNIVAGNLIGTDATGNFRLGNASSGVNIAFGSDSNRIGSNGDGSGDVEERNIISGNNFGVLIQGGGSDSQHNVVAGNYIRHRFSTTVTSAL